MALRLYNTLTRQTGPFVPGDPEAVTFYSCGPTVYDDAHIGNFRSFLAADLLRRYIESPLCTLTRADGSTHAGPRRVTHVMNITDVGHMTDDADADGAGEDKMEQARKRLLEAKKSGKLPDGASIDPADPYAIAAYYTERFLEDARKLGLKVAVDAQADLTLMPRATASIPGMIELVKTLIERNHAYAVGQPGAQTVYFAVSSFPDYGRLSGNTLDALRTGAGGRVSESNQSQKRHPADFLLWKSDPAHVMKWDSPWGQGYPGWHLECSAMAAERLGRIIDLHSGGEDNIFPHHECEIAQTRCAFDQPRFARFWFHPRHLFVEGRKMSKSKGNFHTVRDLLAKGHEPAAVRLELIRTHYRSNADFTEQGLKDSARMADRWRRFADAGVSGRESPEPGERARIARDAFVSAMDDDLNIAGAIGAINAWVASEEAPSRADAEIMRRFDEVLGLLGLERAAAASTSVGVFLDGLAPDQNVVSLLEDRAQARAARDWARSDAIRDELLAKGYAIKDVAGGKVEVRRA